MVRNSLLRSAALAVIAAAGALAVPAQAQGGGRNEARAAAREARQQARQEARQERRADAPDRAQARQGEWQARREARQQQRAAVPERAAREQRTWTREGQVSRPMGRVGRAGDDTARSWQGERQRARAERSDQGARGAWTGRDDRFRSGVEGSSRDRYERDTYRDSYRASLPRYTRDDDRYRRHGSSYGWNRNDWRRDRRYDWHSYRNGNRGVFSVGRYYAPYRNYSYRRLGIGLVLDSGFYGSRYWIADPWQYRLPEVYGPYRWVRYYDDVLLIDIYSGEVVDAIHDFFW